MSSKLTLLDDFRDFLRLLNDHDVEYLVVGGHAVSFHGYPRFTHDIDIVLLPHKENAQRLVRALEEFGFTNVGLGPEDFLKDTTVVLGRAPYEIDIMTYIKGVELEAAWQHRAQGMLDTVPVYFIGKCELLANKRAVGRPEDLADVARLSKE